MSEASLDHPAGDELARHAGWLRRVARGLLYDRASADDVVQQAWLAALTKKPAAGEARAWLSGAVRRLSRQRMREEARRSARERTASREEAGGAPGPDDALERLEMTELLVGALRELEEPYRSTLIWHYLDELPLREVARRRGVPLETARTHHKRALAQLRRKLDARRGGSLDGFLHALVPLAGPLPLALQLGAGGGLGAAAKAAGGMWMGSKAGLAGIAVTAAIVAGIAIWQAGGPGEAGPAEDSVRVGGGALEPEGERVAPTVEAPAVAAPPVAPTDEAREALGRPAGPAWTVRGAVTRDGDTPYADAPLEARLVDLEGGEPLLRAELRADEHGRFEWPLDPPGRAVTVSVRGLDPDRYGSAKLDVEAGDPAPQELLLLMFPYEAWLSGVVRSSTGDPIAGALVDLGGLEALTDAGGEYRLGIRHVRAARYAMFSAPGHAQQRQVLEVQPAADERLDVELRPEFAVFGYVEDDFGNGVEGAEVTSFYTSHNPAYTGADGSYRLGRLDPGRPEHSITARKEGFVLNTIEVSVDGRDEVELDLVLTRGVRIEGVVLDPERAPIAGATLYIGFSPNAYDRLDAECDEQGRFVFPAVRRAGQTLVTSAEGYAVDSRRITVPQEGDLLAGLEIVLTRGHFIAGRVVDDEERPVAGASVSAQQNNEYIENSTRTDEEGAFRLEHLPSSGVSLEVYGQTFVRTDHPLPELDRDDVVIQVPRAGGVAGVVVDGRSGEPVESFRIRFVDPELEEGQERCWGYSATWSREGHRFATADGTWTSKGAQLPPGKWLGIQASADGYGASVAAAVEVVVDPDPAALLIELWPESVVRGTVVSAADGQPVAGAVVKRFTDAEPLRPHNSDDVHGRLMAHTDVHGRFELRGVPAGEMSISVEAEGFVPTADGPFEVPTGASPPERQVALGLGATVRGRLLDGDGAPLVAESVHLRERQASGHIGRDLDAITDEAGAFRFERVVAGRHELAHVVHAGRWRSIDALSHMVAVPDGGELEHDLRPLGSATVRGGVSADEELPAGVAVHAQPMGEVGSKRAAYLDGEGRFTLSGLEPGRYTLRLQYHDWETGEGVHGKVEVELLEGADEEHWIQGHVTRPR